MIRLVVLGSGSKGNAFAVVSGDEALLVDAGFGPKALLRRAAAAGIDVARVQGIVLTHEHGDHAQGGLALAARLRVPVLCSRGTWQALGRPGGIAHHPVRPLRPLSYGAFRIESCLTSHDAVEPLAVAVEVSGARIAFATDVGRLSAGVRYLFRAAHAVVVESNYDEVLLRTGRYPPSVQQRIAGSTGHLSNHAAADFLAEVCHSGLSAVVLAHLSQQCNTAKRAREVVEPVLRRRGFRGELWVAEQDWPLPAIEVRAPAALQGELALAPP